MNKNEIDELQAQSILDNLEIEGDNTPSIYEGETDIATKITNKDRIAALYMTLEGIDSDLQDNQENMGTETLLKYRSAITNEINSLEGRDSSTDSRKFIPMNVTFNIQHNH